MNDERIGALIDDLGNGLVPVRPLRHPALRVLPVFILAAAWIAGAVLYIGIRHDVSARLADGTYLFELLLSLGIAVTAMLAVAWLAVPDMRGQGWVAALPLTLAAVLFVWMLTRMHSEGVHIPHIEWSHCITDGILTGFIPAAALVGLARRGATVRPYLETLMSILAVGAMGWAALRITCAADDIGHCFLYHFLPFVAAGAVMGALARRLYRW